jgi:hypothetical protein
MKTEEKESATEPRWAALPLGPTLRELKQLGNLLEPEDARQIREAIEEARKWMAENGC